MSEVNDREIKNKFSNENENFQKDIDDKLKFQ